MIEKQLLEIMKKDIIQVVSRMELDNASSCRELMAKQLRIINHINEMSIIKRKLGFHIKESVVELDESSNEEEVPIRKAFILQREIRGGVLEGIGAYIPEGIIRKLNLQHGDKLYATPEKPKPKEHNRYHYELAEKGNGKDDPNRIQYNFCPVVKEAGRLVVDRSAKTGEHIRYNDMLFTIVLTDDDVFTYKIQEGDLIDIAFYESDIKTAKVIWKHRVKQIPESNKNHLNKPKSREEKQHVKEVDYEQSLSNKTVLVIGNEPMKHLYKSSIEQRGGYFLWGDTNFSLDRLEVLVKKSDVCVFLLKVSGHVGMEHIKQMCKDYDVLFETTWSNGQSSVIRIAEEA